VGDDPEAGLARQLEGAHHSAFAGPDVTCVSGGQLTVHEIAGPACTAVFLDVVGTSPVPLEVAQEKWPGVLPRRVERLDRAGPDFDLS
jgi:hypothetical protein